MRRCVTIALVAAALLGGFAGSVAAEPPGPNGNNDFGLCRAYFSGSDKGQEKKHGAPPFAALEDAAEESGQSVEEFCAAVPHPGPPFRI